MKSLTGYIIREIGDRDGKYLLFLIREQADEIFEMAKRKGFVVEKIEVEIPFAPGVPTNPPLNHATAEIENGLVVGWSAPPS